MFIQLFGENVHIVGGYVRDSLLECAKDEEIDILVNRHPVEEIIEKLKPLGKVDLVGKSFGVIKFTIQGRTYDIVLPRTDHPTETKIRGHKDFVIAADPNLPLEEDLMRRDFRCNSIALRLIDGSIIPSMEFPTSKPKSFD